MNIDTDPNDECAAKVEPKKRMRTLYRSRYLGYRVYIADGFKEDAMEIVEKFLATGSVRFGTFVTIFKEMHMNRIFSRESKYEVLELSEEVILVSKHIMLEDPQNYRKSVAGLYLLYSMYHIQPEPNFAHVIVVPKDFPGLQTLLQTALSRNDHDVWHILYRLLTEGPAQFHITERPYGIDRSYRKYFQETYCLSKLNKQVSVLAKAKEELDLLRQLTALSKRYHQTKAAISGEGLGEPSEHLSYSSATLAGELAAELQAATEQGHLEPSRPRDHVAQDSATRHDRISEIKARAMGSIVTTSKHRVTRKKRRKRKQKATDGRTDKGQPNDKEEMRIIKGFAYDSRRIQILKPDKKGVVENLFKYDDDSGSMTSYFNDDDAKSIKKKINNSEINRSRKQRSVVLKNKLKQDEPSKTNDASMNIFAVPPKTVPVEFEAKNRKRQPKKIDWTKLTSGDTVKKRTRAQKAKADITIQLSDQSDVTIFMNTSSKQPEPQNEAVVYEFGDCSDLEKLMPQTKTSDSFEFVKPKTPPRKGKGHKSKPPAAPKVPDATLNELNEQVEEAMTKDIFSDLLTSRKVKRVASRNFSSPKTKAGVIRNASIVRWEQEIEKSKVSKSDGTLNKRAINIEPVESMEVVISASDVPAPKPTADEPVEVMQETVGLTEHENKTTNVDTIENLLKNAKDDDHFVLEYIEEVDES